MNVGTLRGRTGEVVEILVRRKTDICCAQKTRWKGRSARLISGKGFKFKCSWIRDNDGFGGVAILIASKWIQNVISVNRINSRLRNNWILVDKSILTL